MSGFQAHASASTGAAKKRNKLNVRELEREMEYLVEPETAHGRDEVT